MAKTFPDEETVVKQQILNLAAKLYVMNPKQTHLLVQYVFSLAKYDTNYDTRDKARLLRALLFQADKCPALNKHAKKILLASKPAPLLESIVQNHDQYTLGTLSYIIGQPAAGYKDLPDFSLEPLDSTIRDVEIVRTPTSYEESLGKSGAAVKGASGRKKKAGASEKFYSDEEDEDDTSTEGPDDNEDEDEDEDENEEDDDDEEEEEEEDEDEEEEDDDDNDKSIKNIKKSSEYEQLDARSPTVVKSSGPNDESSEEEEEEEEEEESEEEEEKSGLEESTDDEQTIKKHTTTFDKSPSTTAINNYPMTTTEKSLLEDDFESFLGITSAPTVTVPTTTTKTNISNDLHNLESLSTSSTLTYTRQYECLNRITGQGLQIQYRFPRQPFPRATNMVHIELIITNTTTNQDIQSIKFIKSKSGVNIQGFNNIDTLPSSASIVTSIGVDFNDTTQVALFDISIDGRQLGTSISIPCHVGELFEQKFLNEQDFNQNIARLRGMHEITGNLNVNETQISKFNFTNIQAKIIQCANVSSVPSSSGDYTIYRFSGQTISSKALVLITIQLNVPQSAINFTINSDRIVLATMLLKDIQQVISAIS
ncbi:hypothetical protein I4U23_029860 [Adineta vaga]|nr:hypothetical protein I4U23_029860 [Adineta vaga]